jgi:hypothetical protein
LSATLLLRRGLICVVISGTKEGIALMVEDTVFSVASPSVEKMSNSVSTAVQLWKPINLRNLEEGDNTFSENVGSN